MMPLRRRALLCAAVLPSRFALDFAMSMLPPSMIGLWPVSDAARGAMTFLPGAQNAIRTAFFYQSQTSRQAATFSGNAPSLQTVSRI